MNQSGSGGIAKLVIIGIGGILLYSHFGGLGLIALGVILMMTNK